MEKDLNAFNINQIAPNRKAITEQAKIKDKQTMKTLFRPEIIDECKKKNGSKCEKREIVEDLDR